MRPSPQRCRRPLGGLVAATLSSALVFVVSGCSLFSGGGGSSPAASTSEAASAALTPTPTAVATPAPSPTPQLVHSLTLVASLGAPAEATPAGLAWAGVQDAAASLGVTPNLVQPPTTAHLAAAIEAASIPQQAVVITVGPAAADAVSSAAAVHPTTQYVELGVAVASGSPSNVHGIVFDQAQAGYLAGYVAASLSGSRKVALVGVSATDLDTSNYAAGFKSGVQQADSQSDVSGPAVATVSFVGTSTAPEKGRSTAAALIKVGNDVVSALPDLSGFGAMREACTRKGRLVALESDAWQTLPDVQDCLIVSVLDRADVAVRDAILDAAHGSALPALVVENVGNGGIALSDFHVDLPDGFSARMAGVLAAMTTDRPATS